MIVFCSAAYAQTFGDYLEVAREVLKTEKKAAIAEVMMLTESESTPFWDMYNEYNFELNKVQNMRISTIMDFAKNYETMTDVKADELWTNVLAYQQELLKLKKSYYNKFKKILPAGKAARYFQAENKIEAMINGKPSIASNLPGVRQPVKLHGMGQVTPIGDSQALAKAIMEVIENPERYKGDPQAIRTRYLPESVAVEYEKLYQEMAAELRKA